MRTSLRLLLLIPLLAISRHATDTLSLAHLDMKLVGETTFWGYLWVREFLRDNSAIGRRGGLPV
jgi:hypothetical protein